MIVKENESFMGSAKVAYIDQSWAVVKGP